MALVYDKKIFRNLQEQVEKNKQDITDIQQMEIALNAYGIKVVGQVEAETDIPDDFEGDYGDAYLVGEEAPYDVYVWTRPNEDTPEDHFVDIGPIAVIGPQGPQGPQGETGATGAQGIGWTNSSDNPASAPAGTFGLNATTGDVYQSNGISWVLRGNIKGQQGIQGPQGPTGATGATGAQGPQGPKGDTGSSYQVIGTYASTSVLPDPTLVNPGSAALVGASAPYELYIVVGATQDAQLWEDAGVFNDQAAGVEIIFFEVNNPTTNQQTISLSSSEVQQLSQLLNSGRVFYIGLKCNTSPYPCYFIPIAFVNVSENINYGQGIGFRSYSTAIYVTIQLSTQTIYYQMATSFLTESNRLSFVYDNQYGMPSGRAVMNYCSPYFNQIPVLKANMIITGDLASGGTLSLQVYAASDDNSNWIALANGFLNTNYTTVAQVCSYIATTLNAIGQAPATNQAQIIELIYMVAAIQMFRGSCTMVYAENNNPLNYNRFTLTNLDLLHSTLGIETWNNDDLETYLNVAVFGDPVSITDSDNLSFTITTY